MKDFDSLIEWTIRYVKYRDLIKKNLKDYKILKNFIEFEFKDKKHTYYLYEELNNDSLSVLNDGFISFVVLNSKKNVDFLVKNWDSFIKYQNTSIFFVNPKINQHWIISPFVHEKISERKSLKLGLTSLFEAVPEV